MSMIEYFTFYDKSGTPYIFQVYPSIGENFPSLAGVYMFTKRVRNQQQGTTTHYVIVTIRIKETFFVFCNRMFLLWHIQQIYANAS